MPTAKKLPKETLSRWRVTLLKQRGHYLSTVQAPDARAAEAAAIEKFALDDEQRKRLAVLERE